ncbi:MAG: hypothetical protein WBK91_05065 [Alphaproteobacteria bacterium]
MMASTCVILDEGISTRKLRNLAADPGLTIEITALEPGRLPAVVKAHIWSRAEHFLEPALKRAEGDIIAPHAMKIDLSTLEDVAGATNFQSLTKYVAPRQIRAGDLNVNEAAQLSIPSLQFSGNIVALQLRRFHAPRLQISGHVLMPKLSWLRAEEWQEAGTIQAPVVEKFSAPKIDIYETQTLLLPPAIKMKLQGQSMRMLAERLTQNTAVPALAAPQAPTRVVRSGASMRQQIHLAVR